MALKFDRLERRAIRALKAGDRLTEHGITAQRTATGDLRYSINIMSEGQRVHRVIGKESEGVTREQAERAIEVIRTRAREDRLDLPTGRKNHRTFREAATEYLERIDGQPKLGRNMVAKRRHVEQRLAPYFKDQRADKINNFTVQHYVRSRLGEGAKQATVNRELATLSHFFRRAIEWRWMDAADKPKIEMGQEEAKAITVLDPDAQEALLRAAIADQDPLTWLFVAFGLNTAMRHSEILAVRWTHIDFAKRRIHIPKAKAGKREQPITAALAEMLAGEKAQRPDDETHVFPSSRADAISPHRRSMAKQFARAVRRAHMDTSKVTPHIMRHTAITALVDAGVPTLTLKRISGHKTDKMVERYYHPEAGTIDRAVEIISTRLPDTITPKLHTERSGRGSAA